uniref:tetratricopeptide repeat-containing sulfotransferase family protein n=1 Tax=Altererythrobacter segetis TaxID=1104773 RepID=UPI00140B03D4|nr:sulfotransferase [Altererythrobacter segetis]
MTLPPSKSGETDRDVAALRLVQQFQQALLRKDRAQIVDSLRQLIELAAPMAGQWLQLAPMAADLGEFGLARKAIDLFVDSSGRGPDALIRKVDLLAYIGAIDEALALLRTLPPNVPDPFSHALSHGALASAAGESEEARLWLEKALRLRPQSGQAWHLLAMVVDFAGEPDLAERLFAAERDMQAAPRVERAYYYYALGKARADRGDHARAFAAVARAGGETRAEYPYDRVQERQSALEAVRGYDADRIANIARQQTEPTDRSIFVMGLPRSGTTLVQQVLTSHSQVSEGGEINLLRWLVRETGDASHPALDGYVQKAGAPSLARLWHHLLDQRFPRPGRVVDKTTNTTRKLGVVAALLPEAPLIWLRRDPLDCAWSCFRTCFMENIHWSNDLGDIAFFFRLEDQLLEQWQAILGDRLLVVPFEELATEPEPWIRRIVGHCGLAVEPEVFAPHENRRPVITPSVMQVRRPINRTGIGSAEPYRKFLEPFVEAYSGS